MKGIPFHGMLLLQILSYHVTIIIVTCYIVTQCIYFYFHVSTPGDEGEIDPWWAVDLQGDYDVYYVMITNRGDCCGK